MASSVFSQTENYKKAFDSFEVKYNGENYDEIFSLFSTEMQGYLPLEKTKQFLTGLKTQTGNIVNKKFVGDKGGTGAIYRTEFERAVLGVYISLDNQNKISGLLIKAYEKPKKIKNASVNGLNDYPKNISEIIFSSARNLPNDAQLSIAIIQNNKTEFYGVIRDQERINQIENEDKIFEIGSISKVFTSAVLASLVEENKIKLNDKINSFYPFNFKDDIELTFQSLANHSSGMARLPENMDITNTTNPYKSYGKKEIEEYLRNLMKLDNDPTKTYAYSNLGAGLLGWHLLQSEGNKNLYWHNGGTGGYSSFVVLNAENKSAVIILSNVSDINGAIDNMGFELLKDINK